MYGEEGETRYERPASPLGVRIVVVILLISGLALAALPLTVLLTGGTAAGHVTLRNASGEVMRGVRVIRIVGTQERLVGSAHDLADGAATDVEFDADGALRLRIEFESEHGRHTLPIEIPDASAEHGSTEVRLGPGFAVHVAHDAAPPAPESSALPEPPAEPQVTPPPAAPETASAPADDALSADAVAALPGPFAVPDGWSEKWTPWFAHVDWVIGPDAGRERAAATGKPMMLFYTATW